MASAVCTIRNAYEAEQTHANHQIRQHGIQCYWTSEIRAEQARTEKPSLRQRENTFLFLRLGSDGAWVLDGTNLNANSYAYVGDGSGQRVTWLWEVDGYKLTAGLEFDGTESVTAVPEAEADGYYAAGTEVTLTPVIPEDSSNTFRNWYGDVPEGSETRNPLVLTMDAARTVYANFNRNWRLVEGAANQITDGSWVLRINPLNNGTCSLGVDANTHSFLLDIF